MIWALLIALILAGGDSVFINPKVKKHVRRHVENKETRKEILDKFNQYEKTVKKFAKDQKNWSRNLDELNSDRDVGKEEFVALFTNYMMADALKQYEKAKKDKEKHIRKLEKLGIKLITSVEGEIEDPEKAEKALKVSRDFQELLVARTREFNSYNYIEHPVLEKKRYFTGADGFHSG